MKKGKLLLLSMLIYIIIMILFYGAIAFVKLEIDYHEWNAGTRAGWLILGILMAAMPVFALCALYDNK